MSQPPVGRATLTAIFFPVIAAAITGWLCSPDRTRNDCVRASDPGIHGDSIDRAVMCAGSALHAGVNVGYLCFLILNLKNSMWANLGAQPAARAFFNIKSERGYIFQVSMPCHRPNRPAIQRVIPANASVACEGMAKRSSLRTPEREV